MFRRSLLIALLALVLLPAPQASAQGTSRPGNLLVRMPWGRLEIVLGRLRLTRCRLGHESQISANVPERGIEETLAFSAKTAESARLRYEYSDAQQQLRVEIDQAAQVAVHRLPCGESRLALVRLQQPLRGPLTLVVGDGQNAREFAADGLWQLMLAEPDVCRQHLNPILQSLRSDWMLEEHSQQTEQALLMLARSQRAHDRAKLTALVEQLGDPQFSRRQGADRQLREMGQPVVSFLDRLDERTLNAEQRSRIRQIKQAFRVDDGDTPERVASWLAEDRSVWLSLLERKSEATRTTAAQQLGAILGQTLAFDPAAGDTERHHQVRRLRADLGLEQPILVGDVGGNARR
ncbi:MAG: hypothetical protein MUE50_21235 [Pirellulaceae bacterium]|nr:hypothetical protein [Pirellulaceae bacterium]